MKPRIGLMFAGQGAQFVGMGHDLAEHSPAARRVFDEADHILQRPLSELCFNGPDESLTDTANCQPAIYTVGVACWRALEEQCGRQLEPKICGGLSLGEFAALHAAGVVDFATGLRLLDRRGQLMARACRETAGAMAAVLNGAPEVIERVCRNCDVDLANLNCPGQTVISGEQQSIAKAVAALKAEGIARAIPLPVAGAFHSRLMATAAAEFEPLIARAQFAKPICSVVQNRSGQPTVDVGTIKQNLQEQIAGSVLWEQCAREMIRRSDLLIELGPGTALAGFARRIDRSFPVLSVGSLEQAKNAAAKLAENQP